MIYTLTLNPSIDYIVHVSNFKEGKTNRSRQEEIYPGGKGFNVSTILDRLQIPTTALGFIAGFTGQEIKRLMEQRGFLCELFELEDGQSRINIKMKDTIETEINASGPFISQASLERLFTRLACLQASDWLVLAGSIPPSLPTEIYTEIMKLVSSKEVNVVVDTSGEALLKVLPYHPFLIKPNLEELEALFQCQIKDLESIVFYAQKLQQMGACNVLVSLGKEGALLVDENHYFYQCPAASGVLKNSVGSGDSMVAGFIAGYLKSDDFSKALRLGSACGGATAFCEDLAEAELIEEVYQHLNVTKVLI